MALRPRFFGAATASAFLAAFFFALLKGFESSGVLNAAILYLFEGVLDLLAFERAAALVGNEAVFYVSNLSRRPLILWED